MKHFLTLLRQDVGKTLALTVGSPSVHRRSAMLKPLFFAVLFLIAGIGNVWATDYDLVYTLDGTVTSSASGSSAYATAIDIEVNGITWNVMGNTTLNPWGIGGKNLSSDNRSLFSKGAIDANILKIDIEHGAASSVTVNAMTVEVATDADFTDIVSTCTPTFAANNTVTVNHPDGDDAWTNCYYRITYSLTIGGSNKKVEFKSAKFYKEKSASAPDLSATPVLVDFGTVEVGASVASQTVAVTFANLTGSVTYSGLSDPFTASGSISTTGDEITISADATNAGTFEQTLLIESAADSKSVEVTVKMKVAAPTGTFELYSGDITEGDYVICSGAKAMKNVVTSSPRIDVADVTISDDKIVNPDESVIWKFEALTGDDAGYWTFFNEAVSKYAAFTSADGRGTLIDAVTDYAKFNHADATSYDFQNKGKTGKYLRYNNTYGFASYGNTTGSTLTLYKKSDGTSKTPAGLAYNEADQKKLAVLGASFVAPTLTNPNSLTVTYESNNTDVAEVANDGTVTIKAAGVAEITASFAGNDDYKAGSASYTIGVTNHAGTEVDSYDVADAKIVIDAVGTKENAYVSGIVSSIYSTSLGEGGVISFYISADGATSGQQLEAYKCKALNGDAFTALSDVETGATVVITGTLKKFNSTYEFDQNCHLVSYEAPVVQKQSIANDQDHPYTVAQALAFAAAPTTYDLSDHVYIQGVVYQANSFNSTNGTYNIYIKDAGTSEDDGKFEFYKCSGLYQVGDAAVQFAEGDVQVGNVVIGYGVMTYYTDGSIWEFGQPNQLVDLQAPVTGVELDATASVEVDKTVTLTANVLPSNAAAQTIVWSVESGSDKASVDAGVVTGLAEGEATIRATVDGTSFYAECTVTVTPVAAPDTRKVANGPAEFTTTSGNLDPADIAFEAFQGGAGTAPGNYNKGIRLYQAPNASAIGGFVTLSAVLGCTIDQVQITTTSTYATTVAYSVDANENLLGSESVDKSGTYTTPAGLNVSSVNIVNKGTSSSGRLEIASIKVWYTGDPATIDHYELGGTYATEFEVGDEFNHTGLIVYAAFDALGDSKLDITSACTFSTPDMSAEGEQTIEITYKGAVVKSYTITVSASTDTRKVADSPATFTTISGDMTPADIKFAAYQGGAGTAPGNYNSGIRLYQAPSTDAIGGFVTLKAAKGCTIDQVQITTTSTYATTVAYSVDANENLLGSESVAKSGTYTTPTGLNVESVNIVNKGTGSNGRLEIASIKVWYTGDPLAVDHYFLGGTYATEFEQFGTFSYEGLTVTAAYDAGETITEAVTGFTVEADLTTAGSKKAEVYLGQVKIAEYDITVNASAKTDPALAYTPSTQTIAAADVASWSAPAFSNEYNVSPITFVSDKPAVATVDENGVIALAGGYGTAVITASFAENDDYVASEATYTITVSEPVEDLSGTWVVATSVAVGDRIIIGATYENATKTMGAQNGNNRLAVASTLDAGVLTPAEGTKTFTLVDAGDGKFALQALNGNYLSAAGSGTSNYLKEAADYSTDNAKWSISIDGEGVASVVALSNNRNAMQYNSGNTLFSCYASVTSQRPINIYKQGTPAPTTYAVNIATGIVNGTVESDKATAEVGETVTLTITPAGGYELSELLVKGADVTSSVVAGSYEFTMPAEDVTVNATFTLIPAPQPTWETVRENLQVNRHYTVCLEKNIVNIDGATFWSIAGRNSADTEAYLEEVAAPEAGKPYIFQATATTLKVVYGDEVADNPVANGALRGTFSDMNAAALAAAGSNIYMLFNNELRPIGDNNHLDAHRAYVLYNELKVISTPQPVSGKRVKAMPMQPKVATGVESIQNSEVSVQKVMINGELYILRGEKMYDTTGRLVK